MSIDHHSWREGDDSKTSCRVRECKQAGSNRWIRERERERERERQRHHKQDRKGDHSTTEYVHEAAVFVLDAADETGVRPHRNGHGVVPVVEVVGEIL